ncbi:uncharacterized protein LOC110069390 isoform X2 [Orbicella faveolata]|uniref:uncharacterized protein LOC110069390 isoform X2 n=1 Tax=Orbicella faveolata TaxID=48498 RepID=UPI0009E5AC22|nr:uncharacterized protein LOC110069390 isoform X2 [Orbicella faveolata]
MATAPDPDEVLRSTKRKENLQRISRLLISGGTTLLREIFDLIFPPSNLPAILKNPATEKQLRSAKLTKPQWDCLYPSPGVYGKSADFDVTLLFRLLRTICNLTPPTTGWDALPTSTDHSLAADLARIKYYRNTVYGHVNQSMEITDDEFLPLWQDLSEALVRIAGQISPSKKRGWQMAILDFLRNPLTAEDERNAQELREWYRNDIEVKEFIAELKSTTKEMQDSMERLETSLKVVDRGIEDNTQLLEEKVGGLETTVREEAQDIKDQLGEMRQSMDRLSSFVGVSQTTAARVRLQIDCETISGPGPQGGSTSDIEVASQEQEPGLPVQGMSMIPITSHMRKADPRFPTAQQILNLAASKYLETIDPSKPEELNGLVYYLQEVRNVLIVDTHSGSLIITVECRSLEILDELWYDYCNGVLNEMVQKFLVTEEVLKEVGVIEVKLTTTILEEDYRACREYLLQHSVAISHDSKHGKVDPRRRRNDGEPSWYDKAVNMDYQEEVMQIPKDKVGLIIGTRGRRKKEIMEKSGVKKFIIREDQVHLGGREEQRANAKRIIDMILKIN